MSQKGFLGDFSKPSSLTPAFKLNYGLSFDKNINENPPGVFQSPIKDDYSLPKYNTLINRRKKSLFPDNDKYDPPGFSPNARESFKNAVVKKYESNSGSFMKATVSKPEDSIELYFDYKSLDKSPSCGKLDDSRDQPQSEDDACCVLEIRKPSLAEVLLERRLKDRKYPKFIKYIPVSLPMTSEIPKILHNEKDMAEWEEAQQAYEDMKLGYPTTKSRSDVHVRKPAPIRKKLNKLIHRRNFKVSPAPKTTEEKKKNDDEKCKLSKGESSELFETSYSHPKETDERFSEHLNLEFLNVNIDKSPKFSAHLYATIAEENANYALCHVKTELLASCLQTFLFPYGDVECFWVTNLPSMIQELTSDVKLRPLLRKLVDCKKFEAALVLSPDASKLIRHKDTCFLRTLTTVLQIPHHKLLVLRNTDEYEL